MDRNVVALRFDEESVAEELARWCGGELVVSEGLDGHRTPTVYVRTDRGPRPAVLGDWIVRLPDGGFRPCSDAAFRATYEPQPSGVVEAGPAGGATPAQ